MKRASGHRRRPSVHITLGRAARLHRLVATLGKGPRTREEMLWALGIGLRTFYRELELLKRCNVKVRFAKKLYVLHLSPNEAEGRLPFPDPQLSFAEMAELSQGTTPAARRLAELLASVLSEAAPETQPARKGRKKSSGRLKR
jgi:hypothetical protein